MTGENTSGALNAALRALGQAALKMSDELEQAAKSTRHIAGSILAQLMTPDERESFSMKRYSASVWAPEARRGLRTWEKEWFSRTLPGPPARLLVGACGTGREVVALAHLGYEVDAFDGAQGALEVAKRECPQSARITQATYRDLVAATLRGETNSLALFTRERYAAVLLGWGSLTHVSGPTARREVLRACAALTDGPILLSFFSTTQKDQSAAEGDRWVRLGKRLGRAISRGNGPSPVDFSSWGGFAEYLTKEELAGHGATLRRRVEWDESNSVDFPHVTLHAPR